MTSIYKIADVVWQITGAQKALKGYEWEGIPQVEICLESYDPEILLRQMNLALVRDFDGLVLHCAAIVYKGKGYLFAAPSGTGKTTHILLWKKAFGDKVQILNGDKPFLRCEGDEVFVHSSPFQGKENLGMMGKYPLGCIYTETGVGE